MIIIFFFLFIQIITNNSTFYTFNKINKNLMKKFLFKKKYFKPLIDTTKNVITISPAGYRGFYQFGVCKFIKENYSLDNYIFSGASAGAWNSLLLSYKGNLNDLEKYLFDNTVYNTKNLIELENLIKNTILSQYKTDDFELNKLYIGVTEFNDCKINTIIYNDFSNLEDAVNCCVASSHIPFITGGYKNIYKNSLSFDGGFSIDPYLDTKNFVFKITPDLWNTKIVQKKPFYFFNISDYTTIFSREYFNFNLMIEQGYNDSEKNKKYLDQIFRF